MLFTGLAIVHAPSYRSLQRFVTVLVAPLVFQERPLQDRHIETARRGEIHIKCAKTIFVLCDSFAPPRRFNAPNLQRPLLVKQSSQTKSRISVGLVRTGHGLLPV